MATEKQAKIARDQHFDHLQKLGAHTLAIDTLAEGKKKSFAIFAFVDGNPGQIPESVEVKTGTKTTKVPVIVEKSEKFKPE